MGRSSRRRRGAILAVAGSMTVVACSPTGGDAPQGAVEDHRTGSAPVDADALNPEGLPWTDVPAREQFQLILGRTGADSAVVRCQADVLIDHGVDAVSDLDELGRALNDLDGSGRSALDACVTDG